MRHLFFFLAMIFCSQSGMTKTPDTEVIITYIHQLNYPKSLSLGVGLKNSDQDVSVMVMNDRGFYTSQTPNNGEVVFDHLVKGAHYEIYVSTGGQYKLIYPQYANNPHGLLVSEQVHNSIENYLTYTHGTGFYQYLVADNGLSDFQKKYIIQEFYHSGELPEAYRHSYPLDPPVLSEEKAYRCGVFTTYRTDAKQEDILNSKITPRFTYNLERVADGSAYWNHDEERKAVAGSNKYSFNCTGPSDPFTRSPEFSRNLLEIKHTWLCLDANDMKVHQPVLKNLDLQYLVGGQVDVEVHKSNPGGLFHLNNTLYSGVIVYQPHTKRPIEHIDFSNIRYRVQENYDTTAEVSLSTDHLLRKLFDHTELDITDLLNTERVRIDVVKQIDAQRSQDIEILPFDHHNAREMKLMHNQMRLTLEANTTKVALLFSASQFSLGGNPDGSGNLLCSTYFQMVTSLPGLIAENLELVESDTKEFMLFQASYDSGMSLSDLDDMAFAFLRKSQGDDLFVGKGEVTRFSKRITSQFKGEKSSPDQEVKVGHPRKNAMIVDYLGRVLSDSHQNNGRTDAPILHIRN